MSRLLILLIALARVPLSALGEEVLIARGAASQWRYLDAAVSPDKTWSGTKFAGDKWKQGPSPLGDGEENLGSVLNFGGDPDAKSVAAWFRHTFSVKDTADMKTRGLYLCVDDGAVVWMDGTEVARQNRPAGVLKPGSTALRALPDSSRTAGQSVKIPGKVPTSPLTVTRGNLDDCAWQKEEFAAPRKFPDSHLCQNAPYPTYSPS